MNQLQIFNYQNKDVRTVLVDGEPWWVAKDVCEVFGDTNYRRSVTRLDDDEKGVSQINTPGGNQEMVVVNEAGLYSLLFYIQPQKGNLPEEKIQERMSALRQFKRWITHEVIPTIRRTGTYSIQLPQTYSEALRALADEVEQKERLLLENSQMKPKAELYDVLLSAGNSQTMGEVAKAYGWGRNKMFKFLRDNKVLMKNNNPYKKRLDDGYFEVREITTNRGDLKVNVTQTLVTAKGIDYIGKLLKKKTGTNIVPMVAI